MGLLFNTRLSWQKFKLFKHDLSRFHQSGFIMDFVLKVSDVANGALVLLIKEQLVNAQDSMLYTSPFILHSKIQFMDTSESMCKFRNQSFL